VGQHAGYRAEARGFVAAQRASDLDLDLDLGQRGGNNAFAGVRVEPRGDRLTVSGRTSVTMALVPR